MIFPEVEIQEHDIHPLAAEQLQRFRRRAAVPRHFEIRLRCQQSAQALQAQSQGDGGGRRLGGHGEVGPGQAIDGRTGLHAVPPSSAVPHQRRRKSATAFV